MNGGIHMKKRRSVLPIFIAAVCIMAVAAVFILRGDAFSGLDGERDVALAGATTPAVLGSLVGGGEYVLGYNENEYVYQHNYFMPIRFTPPVPTPLSELAELLRHAQNRYLFWERPGRNVRTGRFDTDFAALRSAIEYAQRVLDSGSIAGSLAHQALADALAATRGTLIDPYNRYRPYLDTISRGEDIPQIRHLRGVWLSTVVNIDWPSIPARGTTPAHVDMQRAELRTRFDEIYSRGFNAVIFQISPTADAMFRSEMSPWSAWLTGETNFVGELIDSAGNIFDPLQYAIDLARARNIELHAWINPYRITHLPNSYTRNPGIILSSTGERVTHINELKNEWRQIPGSAFYLFDEFIKWGDNRWYVLDPGLPAARAWIVDRVLEIVKNYDIDAIHFDDYFYPSNFCIENTWVRFNNPENNRISGIAHPDTPAGRADWKRENTEMLIRDVGEAIREVAPWVKFGVSPGGVWKSAGGNTGLDGGGYNAGTGSLSTTSWSNYHSSFADTRRWIIENLIDYLVPQIYWDWSLSAAPYGAIADWWGRLFRDFGPNGHLRNSRGEYTTAQLFIGTGIYRLEGSPPIKWRNAAGYEYEGMRTFLRQEHYNLGNPNISGSMTFTQNQTRPGRENAMCQTLQALQNQGWRHPALIPAMPHLGGAAPGHPARVHIAYGHLLWDDTETSQSEMIRTRYFVIYRGTTPAIDTNNPANIAAIIPAIPGQIQHSWRLPVGYAHYHFLVTAVNRLHDESNPFAPRDTAIFDIDNDLTISAARATASRLQWLGEYTRFIEPETAQSPAFIFTPSAKITNLRLLAISFDWQTPANPQYIAREIRHIPQITPDNPFITTIIDHDTFPNRAIAFDDQTGQTRYFAISHNRTNPHTGPLTLTEFFP